MPYYDFKCPECKQVYEIEFAMDDTKEGECIRCEIPLKRVFASPQMVVKAQLREQARNLHPNQAVVDVDGRPIKLSFIDHGERSEVSDSSVASGIQGARMDEKTGRPVVDVVSNVPDPLGKIQESKRRGNYEEKKVNVNQPYKVRS